MAWRIVRARDAIFNDLFPGILRAVFLAFTLRVPTVRIASTGEVRKNKLSVSILIRWAPYYNYLTFKFDLTLQLNPYPSANFSP